MSLLARTTQKTQKKPIERKLDRLFKLFSANFKRI